MSDVPVFGLLLAAVAIAVTLAVLSNRVSERLRVPAPAIFLLAAALASDLAPELYRLPTATVQRVVTVALAVILFDGGMHLGRARLRGNLAAVAWIGVAGTLVTALALAACAHVLFALPWRAALLLGTALAPTDPAVVFSVLGRREIAGRTGTLLEGESGANDPVGIALMAALLAATGHSGTAALGTGLADFAAQMLIGAAVGLAGGLALLVFIRRVPLPAAGLYPLRTLAGALGLYGVAAAAHGSGFLAVFLAGIVLGDATAPYHRDIKTFHSALASLGEITAFAVLGLTLHLRTITAATLGIGLALAALLAFAVRPLLLGALLAPIRLRRGERAFVLWAGLKGAVPILLGTYILQSAVPDATRIYQIIFIVVGFSVIVQGGLVPAMATWLRVPARTIDPEPFSLGVRLRHQPEGVRRYLVTPGSAADQASVDHLALEHGLWISILIRDGRAIPLTGESTLQPGDEILVQTDQEHDPEALFIRPAPAPHP